MGTLKDVGEHKGTWSDGHYEAIMRDDKGVIIKTVFESTPHRYTVSLAPGQWDRLVAWVEWQRKNNLDVD